MPWEHYNEQQWADLTAAAPQIALAVAAASGSTGQTDSELEAFLRLVQETAESQPRTTLLGRLASDVSGRLAGGMEPPGEDVIADGIHAARRAGALLAVHPDEQQAREVRLWLLEVARTVAAAAKEGGVLGIGGREVSKPEQETLMSIADALGVPLAVEE
ncbi:MAG: hypothetical protein M3N29_07450 [Chloroflexota bacterium]|nr:hypothetical protein [Chloroflexota bacterium]